MAMFDANAVMLVAKLRRVETVCNVKYTRNHQTSKRGSVSDGNVVERGALEVNEMWQLPVKLLLITETTTSE